MTLPEIIAKRRSIRRYQDKPVPQSDLEAVLEAGRLAPSARNAQTWRFVAVKNPALRRQLVSACRDQAFVGEAPVVLVVYATEDRIMGCGQSAASLDCSIALSFMLLQATELGLGTCWLGAFDNDMVINALALPDTATVVAVSPLGYPAEAPDARPRMAAEKIYEIRD